MAEITFSSVNSRSYQMWNSDPSDFRKKNVVSLDAFINATNFSTPSTSNNLRLYHNIDNTYSIVGDMTVSTIIATDTSAVIVSGLTQFTNSAFYPSNMVVGFEPAVTSDDFSAVAFFDGVSLITLLASTTGFLVGDVLTFNTILYPND